MGRDSLNLFSSSANGVKRDSDRRNDRTESGDVDAVQGNPISLAYLLRAARLRAVTLQTDKSGRFLPLPLRLFLDRRPGLMIEI